MKKQIQFITVLTLLGSWLFLFSIEYQQYQKDTKHKKQEEEKSLVATSSYQEEDLAFYQGYVVAKELLPDLEEMNQQACLDQVCLKIKEGYRSLKEQQKRYNNRINLFLSADQTYPEAVSHAEDSNFKKEGLEHLSGLAIDFGTPSNMAYNEKMWNWLLENSFHYGFILRYPKDKERITKGEYDPSHYRYVGKTVALLMKEQNLSLEEYEALLGRNG